MRKSRDIKPMAEKMKKGISGPMHQLNASTLEEQNSVPLIMDQNTTEFQTYDDQDRSNNSVLSDLTADEMQIVNELCELEVNIAMDCSNNASGPVLDEPYNATYGSWASNVEQFGEDTIKNQRIKEIENDLKKYEQLDDATQSRDILWQLGLVENTTIYAPQAPNGSLSTGESDACTSYNMGENAYRPIDMGPISECNETMRQCTTSYTSNSIEQSIRNAANVNPTGVIAPQSENMHNASSIDELSRIYSIEIRGEYPATQSQDIPVIGGSICTPTVWEEIAEEGQTSGRRNEQRSSQETPPTDSENTTPETPEIKKLLSSANLITTGGKTCNIRSSGRKRRNANASCSREDMLTFDSFTLGKFESFTVAGCPDGSLQISEMNRPDVGGHWCGSSWGPVIYYSETPSVSITLRLLRLSKDQTGFNFDFRMAYKMIRRSDAVVRYKNPFVGVTEPTTRSTPTTSASNVTTPSSISGSSTTSSKTTPISSMSSNSGTSPKPTKSTSKVTTQTPITSSVASTGTTSRSDSSVKKPIPEQYLGELISGTYCSKTFSDCDKKRCRLQSPNFPGLYPRNLTCYYAIRQHEVPEGKHPLISVRQPRGQLIAVRSKPPTQGEPPPRELRLWDDCDIVKDHVTIYDGYNTLEPVILKFCGGGEPLPEVVSSGRDLLVVFTTSPYGTFLHPSPLHSLHGFQLDVQVKFVDVNSTTYTRGKRCEFWLKGDTGGQLFSPRHSLPRNSTCLYHLRGENTEFQIPTSPHPIPKFPTKAEMKWGRQQPVTAQPQFRVWLSVLKFHVGANSATATDDECSTTLRLWDGEMMPLALSTECNDVSCEKDGTTPGNGMTGVRAVTASSRLGSNTTLIARYCKDKVPRSCDHAIYQNTSRPCSLGESFISTGSSLTIEILVTETTALRPLDFRALYEFVDLYQDGDPYGNGPCSRIFYSRNKDNYPDRRFRAPRDIFLYGRGGARNLTCVYRFEGEHDEVVKLRFNKLLNGNRTCRSISSPDYDRLICVGSTEFSLKVMELPWANAPAIQRDCFCSNKSLPMSIKSRTSVVEVRLVVHSMGALDDYNNMFFEGTWDFVKASQCSQKRRLKGPSGEIKSHSFSENMQQEHCDNQPWLIEPGPDQYLYVKVKGAVANNRTKCETKNRIVLHSAGQLHSAVCPRPAPEYTRRGVVELFSDGWTVNDKAMMVAANLDVARSIAVEYIIKEEDDESEYSVTWLELTRRPSVSSALSGYAIAQDCEQRCPELDACINSSLWCDGINHCPTGYDEALAHCSILLKLPPLQLGLATIAFVSLGGLLCIASWRACGGNGSHPGVRSMSQHRLKSISSETAIIDGKEVIC
ncbi:hypothetical protein QAD02_019138 [Eretmocerus hayati]|uniref:Uncharacterized protein n=1 Tax=Eretmocerus hayati TaxID=131215 RepID=A0ACC2PIS7_9HYME|nr:hypothetical protein QAD02_019138 [Eretmocerus hayati]